jgi:hypothetical protein
MSNICSVCMGQAVGVALMHGEGTTAEHDFPVESQASGGGAHASNCEKPACIAPGCAYNLAQWASTGAHSSAHLRHALQSRVVPFTRRRRWTSPSAAPMVHALRRNPGRVPADGSPTIAREHSMSASVRHGVLSSPVATPSRPRMRSARAPHPATGPGDPARESARFRRGETT